MECYFSERNYMADEIATREFCNTIKGGVFTSDLNSCPSKKEIVQAGLQVDGTYADNELVAQKDIKNSSVWVIVCGAGGYIEKVQI